MIILNTEDFLLYKAKNDGFVPNREAVLELFESVASYPGVRFIQPAHMSLAPVVLDRVLIRELSEILIEFSWTKDNGKPYVTAEIGIETGSARLIREYMAGKPLPFEPEDWPDLVVEGLGVLNDNKWFPLATLLLGLPGETEEDTIETLELVDNLRKYKVFFVPLLFLPLKECFLGNKRRADLTTFSRAQKELFARCWEHNVRVWGASLLERKATRFALMCSMAFLYCAYYRWTARRDFFHGLISSLCQAD